MALQQVDSLSGGQKSRVAFAVLCGHNPNFLVLGENFWWYDFTCFKYFYKIFFLIFFKIFFPNIYNYFILDEPTNHLDIETIEALGVGLTNYKGGVILVSHDQRLITMVCQELWVCSKGKVRRWWSEIFNLNLTPDSVPPGLLMRILHFFLFGRGFKKFKSV